MEHFKETHGHSLSTSTIKYAKQNSCYKNKNNIVSLISEKIRLKIHFNFLYGSTKPNNLRIKVGVKKLVADPLVSLWQFQ